MTQTILADYLSSLEKYGIPGCDCAIYHNHKPVFRYITGYADSARTKPLTTNNTYWLFSASKLFTCTAVMQLVERRSICLDDPVSYYLPEYRNLTVKEGSACLLYTSDAADE